MSHVKTLQSFGKLKGICTGLGGAYNPGQQNLQVKALTTLLFNAQQVMDDVKVAKTVYDNVTNSRELAFKDVRNLGSRIVSILRSCGAHPLTIADALSANRRLQGRRATPRPPVPAPLDGEPAKLESRIYGRDFATQAYHFAQLVETVAAEPNYQPNEEELTVESLEQKVLELRSHNEMVTKATQRLAQLRKQRNKVFYHSKGSLVEIAKAVKHYVRGVFGFLSDPHADLVKASLTKPSV